MSIDPAAAPAVSQPVPSTFFRRHRWKILLFGFVAAVLAVGALWAAVTLAYSYSEGDRIGYVQKFSRKGWICSTWEGELAMTPVPGASPEIFYFTVRDPNVVKGIQTAEGHKVALHYKEKRGIPSSCFGDTRYFIHQVRTLDQ
ncbi:MAG TPA: hypothetical protein VHO67_17200 [Polyangia bacterium]|nr:hypothetical protein [Polyangia bacterium]